MTRLATALLAVLFLLPACGALSDSAGPSATMFRMIGRSWLLATSKVNESSPGMAVVRDQATWNAWMADIRDLRPPSGDPRDVVPTVDFSTENAVVLWLGARGDTSYSVDVASVSLARPSRLTLQAVETQSCGGAALVITYPLAIVAVPKGFEVQAEWSRTAPCR
jgi:hypothetical protein